MFFKPEEIVKDNDPIIREKSQPVALPLSKEDKEFALKLLNHVKCSQDEELSEKYDIRPAVGRPFARAILDNLFQATVCTFLLSLHQRNLLDRISLYYWFY